jgi:flagellar biosynthesis protein FlhG
VKLLFEGPGGDALNRYFANQITKTSSLVETQWEEKDQTGEGSVSQDSSTFEKLPGSQIREVSVTREPKIWAVAGGKGGVGKSLICANFAIMLSRLGKKVLAVDLDLGGSNLHTCLGVEASKVSIGDWLTGRTSNLKELCMHTREPNLNLITGSADPVNIIRKMENREKLLIQALKQLPYDDIVIDLGAGTQESTVEFFLGADEGILSILPEPTSVENAYRFIRTIYLSKLRRTDVPDGIKEVIDASFDQKNFLGIRTPADLMSVVERLDPVALEVLQKSLESYHPNVIINQVRSQADIDVGRAICSVCRRYFGLSLNYVGYLEYDNSVWKAVRSKNSVINEFPTSILTSRFERITRTLLGEVKGLFP